MKKLLLCNLKYDKNFGDAIINQCFKYILETIVKGKNIKCQISEIDMTGRDTVDSKYTVKKKTLLYINKIIYKFICAMKKIFKKLRFYKIHDMLELVSWYFTDEYLIYKQYYINKIKENDIIIFVGGGMVKYKYQDFYHYVNLITKYASKYNKVVYLNSVGVEGYDEKNIKCKLLKKAINRSCIKMITTRDDIESLKKYIKRSDIIYRKVSDPAVYTNKTYEIQKSDSTEIIGLGVCRSNLFIDNDIRFNGQEMLDLWIEIIKELEKKGIAWKIYTNGLKEDNEFAYQLIKRVKCNKEEKLVIPKTDMELVQIISSFKAIIATRLHSCIVAYSLQVPAVGLVWNNKLKMFGESINYSKRFITREQFLPKYIVKIMEEAIAEQYEKVSKDYKKSVYKAVDEFIKLTIA